MKEQIFYRYSYHCLTLKKLIIMAQKAFRSAHNDKKQKGEGKKNKPQTEYQRERDAAKAAKRRKHSHVA